MILDKTRDGSFDVSHAPEQITQALGESWSRKMFAKQFSIYVLVLLGYRKYAFIAFSETIDFG